MKHAIITIEKFDGTVEKIKTDPADKYGCGWGITAIGYSFRYENGRQMIVHPNSVYRLIIDEIEECEDLEKYGNLKEAAKIG